MGKLQQVYGITMRVTCDKIAVLTKIVENRAKHAAIVKEAREGYVEKARAILEEKLTKIKEGKIVDLTINLVPPVDHTAQYDSILTMLRMHTEPTIELGPAEVQHFIEDAWEWTDNFQAVNVRYSKTLQSSVE